MILDSIENLSAYAKLSAGFADVVRLQTRCKSKKSQASTCRY